MKYYYKCPSCGGKAFLYDNWPSAGAQPLNMYAAHIDGTPIDPASPIACDSCGVHIHHLSRMNLLENKP